MKLHTFKTGGIHPPELKLTAPEAIRVLPVPETVSIPLSQHLGAPAKCIVEKGAPVKTGELIGRSVSFISANVHSSVSGTVARIDNVIDPSGYKKPAVIIRTAGDEWAESIDRSPELNKVIPQDTKFIIERIFQGGIVGMGGACFPANVKYSIPSGKIIDTLIINGVECEPYLTADHRLMLENPELLLVGIIILKTVLKVSRIFIGIEANKPDAISALNRAALVYPGITVLPLKIKYPQGAEKQLVKAIVNREVPSGKLPLDVGCVVSNVGTACAVYEAVQKNKPLIERIVTVTGKNLAKPGNFKVRIGTPVSVLIQAAGGMPADTAKIICGGPMMGKALASAETPVAKGTSGIILLTEAESRRAAVKNCIRCGKCTLVCPMKLEPFLLEKMAVRENWEECENRGVTDCMECGSCSYICPSGRPLLDLMRVAKAQAMAIMKQRSSK